MYMYIVGINFSTYVATVLRDSDQHNTKKDTTHDDGERDTNKVSESMPTQHARTLTVERRRG